MTPLDITAITNFVLAGEAFFLAGALSQHRGERFSSAWFWSVMMALLGVSALMGGVDHGFFEARGLPRYGLQRANWLVIGGVSFCMIMTTATQFFPPGVRRILGIVGVVQLVAYTVAVLAIGSYGVVMINYVPALIFLVVMNLIGWNRGGGERWMVAGVAVLFAATAIESTDVDMFSPLDANGLYHIVVMVALVFLYLGGRLLRAARQP
jgi:Family of unknown function (DUF6962)